MLRSAASISGLLLLMGLTLPPADARQVPAPATSKEKKPADDKKAEDAKAEGEKEKKIANEEAAKKKAILDKEQNDKQKDAGKKDEKPAAPRKAILPGLGNLFGAKKEVGSGEAFNQEKADIELLKSIKVGDKGPELVEMIRSRTPSAEARARLLRLVVQLGDDSFDARQMASYDIEQFGPIAVPVLRQNEREGDQEVVRRCIRLLENLDKVPTRGVIAAACRLLALRKPDGTSAALLDYLPLAEDESVSAEIRNALAAVQLKDGKPDPLLWKATESPDTALRGMALEIYSKCPDAGIRGQIKEKALAEKDPDIRLRMVMGLVQAGKDRTLVPEMIRLMGEVPLDKGWRAEEMLCRLAGEKAPAVALGGDEAGRRKASAAWEKWWKESGKDVNLARLDEVERMLGYTLCVEMDPQNFMGRVVEYGPDKKERWSVKNLNFPTDAILVPGDKVVIAEQNMGTVTQRDIKTGRIEWTEQVYMPCSLQRLSNGNIVVGCRNMIIEWDAKRKKVFEYEHPNQDLAAAAKLPNGNYVFLSGQGNGTLTVVDKDKKVVKTIPVGRTYYWGSIHALSNNRVLVTQQGGIAEFDIEKGGPSVWHIDVRNPYSVQKLPTGTFLLAFQNERKIAEFDRDGKETGWKVTPGDKFRPWRAKRR